MCFLFNTQRKIRRCASRTVTAFCSIGLGFDNSCISRIMSSSSSLTSRFLIASLVLIACPLISQAQFTGFSVPQPISTIPFPAGTACTSLPQVALVPNLGQTEHFMTVTTSGVTAFRATVQGSHDGVTFNDISDVATTNGNLVVGQGYFPVVQINVTCQAASGTFGVRYSGEATAPAMQIAAMQSAQIDKTLFAGASAGTTATTQLIRTPFGTSGGALYFAYSGGGGPTGSILNVSCSTLSNAVSVIVASFPLSSTGASTQFFTVPLLPCDFVSVTYNAGGASANTFTSSFVFNNQTITGGDPCQGATAAKVGVAINTTGTQQLVTPLTGHLVFVCGFNFTLASGAAPVATAQFTTGTGATCGTGTINQTGTMTGVASSNISIDSGGGGYTIFKGATGQGLCLVTAQTTPSAQGVVTIIQQ
jgi:hypothetical protein